MQASKQALVSSFDVQGFLDGRPRRVEPETAHQFSCRPERWDVSVARECRSKRNVLLQTCRKEGKKKEWIATCSAKLCCAVEDLYTQTRSFFKMTLYIQTHICKCSHSNRYTHACVRRCWRMCVGLCLHGWSCMVQKCRH